MNVGIRKAILGKCKVTHGSATGVRVPRDGRVWGPDFRGRLRNAKYLTSKNS